MRYVQKTAKIGVFSKVTNLWPTLGYGGEKSRSLVGVKGGTPELDAGGKISFAVG